MIVKQLVVGDLYSNCYLVKDRESGEGVIIDPGGDVDKITTTINQMNMIPKYILNTHAHFDHTACNPTLKKIFKIKLYLNNKDNDLYSNQKEYLGLSEFLTAEIDYDLNEGTELLIGNLLLKIVETPGHSEGSLCIYNEKNKIIFTGDTLFCRSIGRSDLPGGDYRKIMNSLKKIIINFPGYLIYPGHGEITTIDDEKKNNPFLEGFS